MPVRPERRGSPGRRWPVLLLAASLCACFEEPVEERLDLCFGADGTLVVTAATHVNQVPGSDSHPVLKRRLEEVHDVRRAELAASGDRVGRA